MCFESPFTRMISGLKYKWCPPPRTYITQAALCTLKSMDFMKILQKIKMSKHVSTYRLKLKCDLSFFHELNLERFWDRSMKRKTNVVMSCMRRTLSLPYHMPAAWISNFCQQTWGTFNGNWSLWRGSYRFLVLWTWWYSEERMYVRMCKGLASRNAEEWQLLSLTIIFGLIVSPMTTSNGGANCAMFWFKFCEQMQWTFMESDHIMGITSHFLCYGHDGSTDKMNIGNWGCDHF